MGGAPSQPLAFTVPSDPQTGQKVAFVARATDPDRTARVEIWVDGRRVKTCADSACLYYGGPYAAGTVTYAATSFDKAGNRASTGYKKVSIQAVDTTPPLLRVQHRPSRPQAGQRVTFIARASDPSGVAKIEIKVNGRVVKTCSAETCSCSGGPFPQGTVTYEVTAFDQAGNKAWSGRKSFVVTAPPASGASSVTGKITGERKLVNKVGASNLQHPTQAITATVKGDGSYRIDNLPDGRYRVSPLAAGKFDVISQPTHRDLTCQGRQSHTVNFHIEGVFEG